MRLRRISTHPDVLGNCIEIIQSKAVQKLNYTSSGQGAIKLLSGYILNKQTDPI